MGKIESTEEMYVEAVNAFVDLMTMNDTRVKEAIAEGAVVFNTPGSTEQDREQIYYKILQAKTAVLTEQLNNYKQQQGANA